MVGVRIVVVDMAVVRSVGRPVDAEDESNSTV